MPLKFNPVFETAAIQRGLNEWEVVSDTGARAMFWGTLADVLELLGATDPEFYIDVHVYMTGSSYHKPEHWEMH